MLEAVVDARLASAGLIRTALAAPIGPDHRPRTIGPFAVVAHVLPVELEPGTLPPDFDVRPHPHIGLAAITYLFDGHVTHRDSLGSRHELAPGAIGYMVAGRGVVHSERWDRLRPLGGRLEMMQLLLALPDGAEDGAPSFVPVAADRVPRRADAGAIVRVLAGGVDGVDAPTTYPAPVFLHDVELAPGARYAPPPELRERAVYVLAGAIEVAGTRVHAQQTALLAPGAAVVTGAGAARVLAFGGAPVGPRYLWWNFLHSSRERLEAAKVAWRAGDLPLPPGDTESFTPAPPDDGRPLHHLNAPA